MVNLRWIGEAPIERTGGASPSGQGRRDHALDRELGSGEPRLDAGARRRIFGRQPSVPHGIHFIEGRNVGQPDLSGQQPRLVGAGLSQEIIYDVKDIFGLLGDGLPGGILGHLAGQLDDAGVNHGLGHSSANMQALGAHGVVPSLTDAT